MNRDVHQERRFEMVTPKKCLPPTDIPPSERLSLVYHTPAPPRNGTALQLNRVPYTLGIVTQDVRVCRGGSVEACSSGEGMQLDTEDDVMDALKEYELWLVQKGQQLDPSKEILCNRWLGKQVQITMFSGMVRSLFTRNLETAC